MRPCLQRKRSAYSLHELTGSLAPACTRKHDNIFLLAIFNKMQFKAFGLTHCCLHSKLNCSVYFNLINVEG